MEPAEVRHENGFAQGTQQFGAVQEIFFFDDIAGGEMAEGHFHEHDWSFAFDVRLADELLESALEDIERCFGYWPKASAQYESGFFVQDFGPLNGFALGGEHCGFGQAAADELQRHEAVVHFGKGWAGKADHVHL